MKCHYEILNVSRDADEGEIKMAYKKLALKWHPDKNLDNIEYATEQFQLVQQAYEILSDRQERAWYDNHREQILRGSSSAFKDNNLDVYQYFTTTCFKGYNDEDNGFYTVYRNVFEQIAKEDLEFMVYKEDFCNIPMFGSSTSDYDESVAPFYDFWMSYSTKKSYVWLDPYNIREAKNRRILKIIDKENEKIRQKARKERNEEVRSLVAFVRKRDKRVQAHMKLLETKKLENRQKQEKISKQKRLERLKQLDESSEQAEWMKFENVKSELEEIEKNLAQEFGDEISDSELSSNSEEELDHLYCVACNKVFKNPKAFENHEFSKKHKENVDRLKENMIHEDEALEKPLENISKSSFDEEVNFTSKEKMFDSNTNDELICSSDSEDEIKKTKIKKKNKKPRNVIADNPKNTPDSGATDNVLPEDSDDDRLKEVTKKQKRKKKKENKANISGSKINSEIESELNDVAVKLKNKSQKKEDKKNKKSFVNTAEVDVDHTCVVCKSSFSSKNKLFDHLKKSGHSVCIETNAKVDKKKKLNIRGQQ